MVAGSLKLSGNGRRGNMNWETRRKTMSGDYESELAAWKARHGISDSKEQVNQDELLMAAEESRAKGKCWCFGCDKHMPIREMKLITRSVDPYCQYDEAEGDYIPKDCRVRMCPACYEEHYGQNAPS